MYTFWLVIKELFWFVMGTDTPVPLAVNVECKTLPPKTTFVEIAPPTPVTLLGSVPGVGSIPGPEMTTLAPEPTLVPDRSENTAVPPVDQSLTQALLYAPVIMYVSAAAGTPFQIAPQQEFDGVTEVLPYGSAVTVVGYRGRYASVLRHHTGFVLKDHLQSDKTIVWPQFVSGTTYLASDPVTIMVRSIIADEFGAGALAIPLQAGEYIVERLLVDGRRITWSNERPRLPGTWQNLLKGTTGIHSGIAPKTDSVMEWNTDGGEGRLAYVETVAPDSSIQVSLVGLTEAGVYETKVFTSGQWRELRPVFIEVA